MNHAPAIVDPVKHTECPRHKAEGDKACPTCNLRIACEKAKKDGSVKQ